MAQTMRRDPLVPVSSTRVCHGPGAVCLVRSDAPCAFTRSFGSGTTGRRPRRPTIAEPRRSVHSIVSPSTRHEDSVMPQTTERPVSELKPAELRTIVGEIQKLLWMDEYATDEQRNKGGVTRFWDSQKEGSLDTLDAIAGVLEDHGLPARSNRPPSPVTTHKLDYEDQPIPDDYGDSEDPEDWTPDAKPTS